MNRLNAIHQSKLYGRAQPSLSVNQSLKTKQIPSPSPAIDENARSAAIPNAR